MSLDEKIGQLIMVAAYSNKDSVYENHLEATIEKYHIGGIIFFQGSPRSQALMTNTYQQSAKIPLMIGMDAENGVGWRIKPAMEFPNQTLLGAIRDTNLIYRLGAAIGQQCRTMGIHVNFAPVADINVNPKNPVIGIRSFGEKKEEVGNRTLQYMRGLQSQHVMAVAKHFPGHGDTDVDSHLALPLIRHSAARIDTVELYPSANFSRLGYGSHDCPPKRTFLRYGQYPASLSKQIITDLLRDKLHFDGLCFTDAMNMKGVTKGRTPGEADVEALAAGNDILLFPENVEASVRKIKAAIRKGVLSEEMINEKCRKVLKAKAEFVLPYVAPVDTARLTERLSSPSAKALLQETYAKAIT
ncbi:MAG: glycoside hydrolase family 3 protein, partial [Butyricimonas paravirosa]